MKDREETMEQADSGLLSIPNVMLEAAGILPDSDLTVEAIPGVLLIGTKEPLQTANQPLFDLLAALGISQEEAMNVLKRRMLP